MSRIYFFVVVLMIVLSFIASEVIIAQRADRDISALRSSADFPDFIVAPREDLKPFGMSTLGTSTLDKTTKSMSNLEVNRPKEGRATKEAVWVDVFSEDSEQNNVNFVPLPSETRSRFYRWIDENGVVNVTNDPNSVPSKYRN